MKEVIIGVGNVLMGDDGIGVYVAGKLKEYIKRVGQRSKEDKNRGDRVMMVAINCGTTPENYISIIRKSRPGRLIVVDAADMGLSPGSCRIVPPEKVGVMCISTHNMPLSLFKSYVDQFCQDIVLVGVQPKRMDFDVTLSSAVRGGGDQIVKLIIEKRLSEIEVLKE